MPTEVQHKEKYIENKSVLENEMNINDNTHYNWVTTIAFYAALHLVEGELAKNGLHTITHSDRDTMVGRYSTFRNIRTQYKFLHDKSIVARYAGNSITKEKAEKALSCLKDIEKEIQL